MELKKVGYWKHLQAHYNKEGENLPFPVKVERTLTDNDYSVMSYIKSGKVLASWRGHSFCRICGNMLGSRCLTDGVWQWPEKLEHYVEEHRVILPKEFIEYVLKQ